MQWSVVIGSIRYADVQVMAVVCIMCFMTVVCCHKVYQFHGAYVGIDMCLYVNASLSANGVLCVSGVADWFAYLVLRFVASICIFVLLGGIA